MISPIDNKTLWIGLLAIITLLLLLIVAIVIVSSAARKQRITREVNEAVLQARLSDMRFAALSSQMNPHFIFNCLNSIRLYTEENNSEATGIYLGKFAKLVRKILDNARRNKITLTEEIDTIVLYLEMEKMRVKDKLQFSVSIDPDVDAEFVEIPPMLIQPFVENAIWHGIMPRPAGGTIELKAERETSCDGVRITISDNGIGRTKAAVLKATAEEEHKSHGLNIIHERIELLNAKNKNTTASVTTTDRMDDKGNVCGTLITILLPVS